MDTNALISQLVYHSQKASLDQLAQITQHMAAAPFAEDLLEVDEPLWGSFWQEDVIAPGYRLPAVELAWLRAVRLDKNWPEATTIPQYLADLRRAILDPRAGIWTLAVAGEPCVVFAEPGENPKSKIKNRKSITVVWYCASTGRLHAGYRTTPEMVRFKTVTIHRPLSLAGPSDWPGPVAPRASQPGWLAQAKGHAADEMRSLAARLDAEILGVRLDG